MGYLIFLIALLWASSASAAVPTWVSNLPLNQWYSIPNTALSSVNPSPQQGGSTGPQSKIIAWNGAALKRTGSIYYIGMAGAHNDYAGNEVDALTLNTATPAWTQLNTPSPSSEYYDQSVYYRDLHAAPAHTYNALQVIESLNRLVLFTSAQGNGPGSGYPAVPPGWLYGTASGQPNSDLHYVTSFNLSTNAYDAPSTPVANYLGGGFATAAPVAKHQVSEDVYMARDGAGWWKWTKATNTWAQINSNGPGANFACAVIDPTRGRILVIGDFDGVIGPRVYNLSGAQQSVTFGGLGASSLIVGNGYPGCVYDEVNDNFLMLRNNGSVIDIRRINAGTLFVDDPTVTGTKPTARTNGIHNSVQYVPELGGIAIANDFTGSVKFMRLSSSQVSSIISSFTLTSPSSGTKPFTIGQAFKQGDVPSGQTVASADAVSLQVDIKNAWADGSAKFALISGRAALVANTAKIVSLTTASPPGGAALTETDLTNSGVTASIQYGATCTVNLSSLIGQTSTLSAGRMTAGRVRTWASGPVMSNWIYYSRCGSDAHLSVWFDVRLYSSGEVEIVPWIENSTLNVASPTSKTGTATFVMNGTTRYTASLPFPHHTRAVLASGTTLSHWSGTAPAVTPKHDVAYLQTTKMVPSYYATTSAGSDLWARTASTYTPLTEADIPYSGMGGTGYGDWIGLIPEWEVAYLTGAGDARAYNASIINSYSAGGLDIHFRDETTNQPVKMSSYPNLVIGNGENIASTGASSNNTYTPTASGTTGAGWDIPHHPSIGYVTYLLTARFYFLEELQFVSAINCLTDTDVTRQFGACVHKTTSGSLIPRGAAWALRTDAQAVAVTPDGDAMRTELLNTYSSNVNYYHGVYVAQANNPQGFVKSYDDYNGVGTNPWVFAPWMDDFFTGSIGFGMDIVTGLSGANQAKLSAFFTWKANAVIGRLGGTGATEYYFADAGQFNLPLAPLDTSNFDTGAGPWYANFGAVYDANFGSPHPQLPVDGNLRGGNFPAGTSYWGNLQPAIAYAVSQGVPGAAAAYNRMVGAGNWGNLLATFDLDPIWAVKPGPGGGIIVTPPTSLVAPTNVAVTP